MAHQLLTQSEQARLDAAIRSAEQSCRAEISIYLGAAEGSIRDFATSLHNTLVLPSRSILVLVDPDRRALEIVTGGRVRATLTDEKAASIVREMTEAFGAGDLAGGLVGGVERLGREARAV
ncbi:MAG: TPM domain-containing protein [Nocardioidaceae bacterium]|nr:TPM domain-containing protein [Nocardioidaceae bacterium]MCL2613348.1 TPM domain-containing protein [Nocardioidaceae bacterium]